MVNEIKREIRGGLVSKGPLAGPRRRSRRSPLPCFSNRVIHARISGTTKSPRIQIEPIRLLTEEAVRFFLTGAP
jgi:hypothetical protein